MITELLVTMGGGFVSTFAGLLPEAQGFTGALATAIGAIGTLANEIATWNTYLPVDVMFLAMSWVLLLRTSSFAFRLAMWVYSKIPVVGR